MGSINVGLAYNHNETEVVAQRQVGGIDPVSQGTIDNIQLNLPKDRMVATIDYRISDALSAMVRMNYFSESWDERGTYSEVEADNTKDKIESVSFIDVELNYRVSDNLSVVFGANNATNAFPNQIATRMSQGMPYPRRSPLGYHGGMMFTRLTYNF
jgi:iron complex outermembrane receptor protein